MNVVGAMVAATRLHQNGRFEQAEQIYRQVLALQPRNPDALHLLGLIEFQRKRYPEALQLIERAIQSKPQEPTFYTNLGQVYRTMKQPDHAEQALRRAIQLDPNLAEAHAHLAAVLRGKRQLEEAEAAARRAVELNPQLAAGHMNLGNVLKDLGELGETFASFDRALQLGAPRHEVLNNVGDALRAHGEFAAAQAALEEAVQLQPDMPLVHWNLSLLYLTAGDLPRGFAEYEWRLKQEGVDVRRFDQPMWDGSNLDGRTILLHTEQGFGDAIQFVRYASLIAQRGGRVILECQNTLVRLMRTATGVSEVFRRGERLPVFDVYSPILSLPKIFGTTLETIPAEIPYLRADEKSLPKEPGVRNIGLVWAGNPNHVNDRRRSINPAELLPLKDVENVRWFSLQLGSPTPEGMTDLTSDIRDFADAAAAIGSLDLLISVDTAAAHVAGALGKPVWTLLPKVPDWRWLTESDQSAWYPTMRLFRQAEAGDWAGVIQRVIDALRSFNAE